MTDDNNYLPPVLPSAYHNKYSASVSNVSLESIQKNHTNVLAFPLQTTIKYYFHNIIHRHHKENNGNEPNMLVVTYLLDVKPPDTHYYKKSMKTMINI